MPCVGLRSRRRPRSCSAMPSRAKPCPFPPGIDAMARINHLAIVVDDIQQALSFWHDALGLELGKVERNEGEEVEIAFLPLGESEVELIAPINETSGVAKYLAKRGAGMHHLCLEVDDIAATMRRLVEHGI